MVYLFFEKVTCCHLRLRVSFISRFLCSRLKNYYKKYFWRGTSKTKIGHPIRHATSIF